MRAPSHENNKLRGEGLRCKSRRRKVLGDAIRIAKSTR
jgi:hypothetical protein